MVINRYSRLVMLPLLAGLLSSGGCGLGLGYIDIEDVEPEGKISFRIENGTTGDAEVTILVTVPQADSETDQLQGDEFGDGDGGLDLSAAQVVTSNPEAIVRLPGGGVTTGELSCGQMITISAVAGFGSSTTVQFTGAGTGTPGFDSGSVGLTGERFLIPDTDYVCGDTIVIQIEATDWGNLEVVAEGAPLPDPIIPPDEDGDDGDGDDGNDTPPSTPVVMFRLENATATPADITITSTSTGTSAGTSDDSGSAGSQDGDQEDTQGADEGDSIPEDTSTSTSVRTPAGEFTTGQIACGEIFTVRALMGDEDASSVLFTGDGTGTAGFDSASIGFDGERLLVFPDHYACGETIVIRIADDGSGIGQSTSTVPLGTVNVFSSGMTLPDPDLPDPDQPDDEEDEEEQEITVQIVNQTGSTIQVNFASGNGTLASSGGVDVSDEFDVRVLPDTTSIGTTTCAQEFVVAAAHLEATSSTLSDEEGGGSIFTGGGGANYHGVVLTGDGTGTEGFDEESIAVTRGRLFQLGEHFSCGSTIIVTVTATNNQLEYDEEGELVLDEFGNPTIKYNIGTGTVTVESF